MSMLVMEDKTIQMKKVKTTKETTCTAIPGRKTKVVLIVFDDGSVESKCPLKDDICFINPCPYDGLPN